MHLRSGLQPKFNEFTGDDAGLVLSRSEATMLLNPQADILTTCVVLSFCDHYHTL